MEPNNLENQFAKKLNAREIKPSPIAWDRLDAMLTVVEKPKFNFNWLYFAASFLGFILIGTIFFSQTGTVIDIEKNNVVLQMPIKEKTIAKSNFKNQFQKSISNNKEEVAVLKSKNKSISKINFKNEIQKTSSIKKEEVAVSKSKNTILKKSIINQKNEIINQNQIANVQIPNSQIPNSKTQIQTTNTQKPTYVNVDALLASVEQPTLPQKNEKIFNQKTKVNVNANSLLSQVDGEIELTFREKVIKSVNKNFQTVKVALANRNNN